jgi:hypothetical protein
MKRPYKNEVITHGWKVCEFGCDPGLSLGELVHAAADEQRLEKLVTRQIDLTQHPDSIMEENDSWFQEIDLFVMEDVFENAEVGKGARDETCVGGADWVKEGRRRENTEFEAHAEVEVTAVKKIRND